MSENKKFITKSEVGVGSITMHMFITDALTDVELGSVVTPASGILFNDKRE